MKIHVEVNYWFKRFTQGKTAFELEIKDKAAIIDAVKEAGIPNEEIGFVMRCKKLEESFSIVEIESLLEDGDSIKLYPSIIGG